ncbi:helix-turn-helix domain-containing protein [Streptomyces cocklensis]|uniref:AraC-type DNA-binding protein n=1 Tax=Actinacidiphila cocklensis TaxID=887465 RepID=A0A9W4E0D8_9ACTN|nr:helix-turn-helix domain-containing protein [Actinacidiphila cocklensis]MDD1059873.1 helix-turn-helix domain-containing protein [Actinacidiphila cocklensis]WSX72740.1 helix-turn-helix domain-containing protein [Streptomyces sp. NBC_00899]WSX81192.1 helix-turn-helix domain-containing protein [Streptomyces sp. NBC_00899]CAG6397174.1 AraC-type DNA-binding protein [Actinacidiphila cocklensis]
MLSTRSVPLHESMEFWHDAVFTALVGMDISAPGGTYDATMRTDRLGGLQIITVDCDPGRVDRSPRYVAGGDGSQVFVAVQGSGLTQAEQDGRMTELRVGDICFFETVRPFRTTYPGRFQQKIFAVPREMLGRGEADLCALTGRALRPSGGLPALLSPYLSRLADASESYSAAVGERLGATVADLLAATVAEDLDEPSDDLPGAERVLLLRVQGHIRWHLADPALGPQAIARAHGISVRYLHRLFEGEGTTVSRWIRDLRLQECRRELATTVDVGADLGQIAHRWGFSGPSQLGKVFRASVGLSPTDWLRQERIRRDGGEQPWPATA